MKANSVNVTMIQFALNRETATNLKNQACNLMEIQGITLIIDTTVGGFILFEQLSKDRNVPYIQVVITQFPMVESIIKYIRTKFGKDYAVIFQSAAGK